MSRILSFQREFRGKLLDGTKVSTIRNHKRPLKVGEIVQVYCPSPRSGHGEKLFDAEIEGVEFPLFLIMRTCHVGAWIEVYFGRRKATNEECENLAGIEGFDCFSAYPDKHSFESFFFEKLEEGKITIFTHYLFKKVSKAQLQEEEWFGV